MSLVDDFKKASSDVQKLSKKPDNETLLRLYALFKQASIGDNNGKRPGMLDVVGRKKFDAWAELSGTSEEEAKKLYIEYVQGLIKKDKTRG